MDKTQLKFADLDFIPFLDVHEIVGNLPVVLSDSPILYAYIMMIHLSRIQHAGIDISLLSRLVIRCLYLKNWELL